METNFDQTESLKLIHEMISKAKQSFSKINFYFLLWGWILLLAGLSEYILGQVLHSEYYYIGWPVGGILGGIIASVHGTRQAQKGGQSSYLDKVYAYLWSAFVVTMLILIVSTVSHGWNPGSFIIVLTGLPTFVTGGIMKFKPLVIGGIFFWVVGLFSFFFLEAVRKYVQIIL